MQSERPVTIITWNILANELLLYLWRGSYGLEIRADGNTDIGRAYYNNIHRMRINNIIERLREYDADIICLQETTNVEYEYLGGKTTQKYIADAMGYEVVSNSYKNNPFTCNYPPYEQRFRGLASQQLSMDSGVSTLLKTAGAAITANVKLVRNIATANSFPASVVFGKGSGSPFTLDKFIIKGFEFNIVNVHIKMEYPSIINPVKEVFDRISQRLTPHELVKTIVMGDFNAGAARASIELKESPFNEEMTDINREKFIDDHVFVGNNINRDNNVKIRYIEDISILEMNVNMPVLDKKWKGPIAVQDYNQSEINNRLIYGQPIEAGMVTSDHYPIRIEFSI